MRSIQLCTIAAALLSFGFVSDAAAQDVVELRLEELDGRTASLQRQVNELSRDVDKRVQQVSTGGISFLFGAFCALWAQNTGRNAWLWFFLGLFFSVIAVLVLLYKNSTDRHRVYPSA